MLLQDAPLHRLLAVASGRARPLTTLRARIPVSAAHLVGQVELQSSGCQSEIKVLLHGT